MKARQPVEGKLRRDLWIPLEEYLVEQRRYADAGAEPGAEQETGLAAVEYYIDKLHGIGSGDEKRFPILRTTIEFTIEHHAGDHFEVLVGTGQTAAATRFCR